MGESLDLDQIGGQSLDLDQMIVGEVSAENDPSVAEPHHLREVAIRHGSVRNT